MDLTLFDDLKEQNPDLFANEPYHSRNKLEEFERIYNVTTGKILLNYKKGNYILPKKVVVDWVHHYNIYKRSKDYKEE